MKFFPFEKTLHFRRGTLVVLKYINVKKLICVESTVNRNKGKIVKLISLGEVNMKKMCGTKGSD